MLPFDRRPWAKSLAKSVIAVSTCALIGIAYYLYDIGELGPPEYVGLLLLFLTIVPPNIAIVRRQPTTEPIHTPGHPQAIVH